MISSAKRPNLQVKLDNDENTHPDHEEKSRPDSRKSAERKEFFRNSIRETDEKIKKLFDDMIEERNNTNRTLKENFDKIVSPSMASSTMRSIDLKFDSSKPKNPAPRDPHHPLNLLSKPNAHDHQEVLKDCTNSVRFNSDPNEIKIDDDYKADNHKFAAHLNDSGLNSSISSLEDDDQTFSQYNFNTHNYSHDKKENHTMKSSPIRIEGETFPLTSEPQTDRSLGLSPTNIMDTLRSKDFNISETPMQLKILGRLNNIQDTEARSNHKDINDILHISRQEIDFGEVYATQDCVEGFEILNKSGRDLQISLRVHDELTMKVGCASFFIVVENGDRVEETSLMLKRDLCVRIKIIANISTDVMEKTFLDDLTIRGVVLINEVEKIQLKVRASLPKISVPDGLFVNDFATMVEAKISDAVVSLNNIHLKNDGKKKVRLEITLHPQSSQKGLEITYSPKLMSLEPEQDIQLRVRIASVGSAPIPRTKIALLAQVHQTELFHIICINLS